MENKYAGLGKCNLKDIQLRLLNELANYKLDSKRAGQRLSSARSGIAEAVFELRMVEEALRLEQIIQFPAPILEAMPVSEGTHASTPDSKKTVAG
jgi:hypothetical protein